MGRRSNVSKLPEAIREVAERLLREGRTVDEITDALTAMGAEVSRSGVGRWKLGAEKALKRFRDVQALGATWAKSLKDDPEGKVGRLLIEIGKANVLDNMLHQADGEDGQPMETKDLFFLSMAAKNFESAGKINADREFKIRAEVAREIKEKASTAVEQLGRSQGLSKDVVAQLRAAVIGVAS